MVGAREPRREDTGRTSLGFPKHGVGDRHAFLDEVGTQSAPRRPNADDAKECEAVPYWPGDVAAVRSADRLGQYICGGAQGGELDWHVTAADRDERAALEPQFCRSRGRAEPAVEESGTEKSVLNMRSGEDVSIDLWPDPRPESDRFGPFRPRDDHNFEKTIDVSAQICWSRRAPPPDLCKAAAPFAAPAPVAAPAPFAAPAPAARVENVASQFGQMGSACGARCRLTSRSPRNSTGGVHGDPPMNLERHSEDTAASSPMFLCCVTQCECFVCRCTFGGRRFRLVRRCGFRICVPAALWERQVLRKRAARACTHVSKWVRCHMSSRQSAFPWCRHPALDRRVPTKLKCVSLQSFRNACS